MKKKLSYRDQLLELAYIYNVEEIKSYIKNKKNLTTGQLELILRKNKIVIPKDFKTSFFKENISKPLSKVSKQIDNLKDNSSKTVNKFSKRLVYLKHDSSKSINNFLYNLWRSIGKVGIAFLNIFPKLGVAVYDFFGEILTNLFHGIYDQQVNKNKASKVIAVFFIVVGITTIIISGISTFYEPDIKSNDKIVDQKDEIEKSKPIVKKPEKKIEIKKKVKKPKIKKKEKKEQVAEVVLPNLNLKTQTVLSLFEDVNYDLKKVRFEKTVKPIYFTQFPKDLDEIQNVRLKKETFIKIVLPLIVAENEKILEDRYKLKKIIPKKATTDLEKQWLRQKFLEYKVKKGSIDELKKRMDIIPASIALAQAAEESGWGTSRFALEGNAIFGQWTWTGRGIEPLLKDKSKNHKILRFPILRASVKAYKNNLNTHKSYKKFREKRAELRLKKKKISGLILAQNLDSYAQTGSAYTKILAQIIIQNRLMDFEPVKLENSVQKQELNL